MVLITALAVTVLKAVISKLHEVWHSLQIHETETGSPHNRFPVLIQTIVDAIVQAENGLIMLMTHAELRCIRPASAEEKQMQSRFLRANMKVVTKLK
jgi:hypothetical protein